MFKEFLIGTIESGMTQIAKTAQAVPDDKLNWKPLDNGRAVLDLLAEAAQTPVLVTRLLASLDATDTFDPFEHFKELRSEAAAWTRDECLEKLHANSAALFEAIRALPDEELGKPVTLPYGGGMTLPLAAWILMPYRTFISRYGQINYIQTLYGDFEPH